MPTEFHKQHRSPNSGRKKAKKSSSGKAARRENPKAFAVYRGSKAAKTGQRTADKKEAKLHVPLINRTPDLDSPPLVVAIVGPPNVGKTTLIRSLVKRFSRQNLSKVSGPITVVSGKARRITLLECPNDLGAMIDVAKIADLVVLLIDASFGFEMETFEFLSIASSHGMPKVIGALTHLDTFTSPDVLRKTKHALKHRWWTEIQSGVKLFSLSGLIGGQVQAGKETRPPLYYPRDILNLSRLLAISKPRPIIWKNTNSYLLVDRIEDMTSPDTLRDAPHSDRKVSLYGWTRGCVLRPPLNDSSPITAHIPGIGDILLNSISRLDDPCPTPERLKGLLKAPIETNGSEKPVKRLRTTLKDLERRLYAPMADVAGILYDKDAVYLDIPDHKTNDRDKDSGEENEITILDELKGTVQPSLDVKLSKSGVRFFSERHTVLRSEENQKNEYETDENMSDDHSTHHSSEELTNDEEDINNFYKESEEELNGEDENEDNYLFTKFEDHSKDLVLNEEDDPKYLDAKWKEALFSRKNSQSLKPSLQNLVYGQFSATKKTSVNAEKEKNGKSIFTDSESDNSEDDFFNLDVSNSEPANDIELNPNEYEENISLSSLEQIKKTRFAICDINDEDGDFEDLENTNNELEVSQDESDVQLLKKKDAIKRRFDMDYDAGQADISLKTKMPVEEDDMFAIAKRAMAHQEAINRQAFDNESSDVADQIRGFLPGTYVRIIINKAPAELIEYFDPSYPIVIGVIPSGSGNAKFGIIHARVKKHRWHETILKSDEPLIFSAGWRRFQSIPLFYTHDRGSRIDAGSARKRLTKYTPRHAHCMTAFYGPLLPNNTGLIACRSVKSTCSGWRISLTGVTLESTADLEEKCDEDGQSKFTLVKKLKLTGAPLSISKHTALIKDMFTSPLEIAKFEGAALRTVSGIRGSVKKAVHEGPSGTFRATFEDKLLMSDVVFLRAWIPVSPRIYYNPVTSLLLRNKSEWKGMRLNWELRRAFGAPKPASQRPSSVYDTQSTPEDRTQYRRFNPLHIPKKLEEALPFSSKPKLQVAKSKSNKIKPLSQALAVLRDEKERKVASLLQQLGTLKHSKEEKRKTSDKKKKEEFQAKQKKLAEQKGKNRKVIYLKKG